LIERKKNKNYFLTALGKVVYDALKIVEESLNDYWKLRAVDSLETCYDRKLSNEEVSKIIDSLIENQKIKDIIRKGL
jgi:hypothetical protein